MWFEHMGWPAWLQGLWRAALGVLGACLLVLCLAGLLATTAWPRMHAGPGVMDGGRRMASPVLPLDGSGAFATPAAAYSMRRLKSSYSGPAMKIQRLSDLSPLDVDFLGFTGFTGAPIDTAAAAAHCALTTCVIDTWYDQSGNGRDAVRSGGTATLVFDCKGTLPCARSTTSTEYLITSNLATAATGALSVVAQRASGAGYCIFASRNTAQLASNAAANTWQVSEAGGGSFTIAASDSEFHAVAANFAGASSVARVDQTETTGTVTTTPGSGPIQVAQGAYVATSQCNEVEAVIWDNYTLTPAERQALTANQKSFWGTP